MTREYLTILLIFILIVLSFLIFKAFRKKELLLLFTTKQKNIRQKQSEANLKNEQFQAINQVTQNHELTKEQIATELHDGLGGTLAAIKMNLMQLKEDEIITKIIDEVGGVATANRYISHDLNPPLLKSQSFCVITEDYLSHIFNNTDIELIITLLPKGKINKLDLDVQLTLYRIIQELCSNVKRHSKATKVNFQLLAHSNEINLIIEDNGIGFTPSNATLKNHKGLQLIKERLIIVDGELEIDSQKDDGCIIYVFIPINNTSK
jgi:signal transduction histidine kinase